MHAVKRMIYLTCVTLLFAVGASATPFAYITSITDATVSVIDTATDAVVATIPAGPSAGIAVSSDGSRVYVTNGTHEVGVIDGTTRTLIATITLPHGPFSYALNPAGTRLYASMNEHNTVNQVAVIDTSANSVLATVTVGQGPTNLAVTPDGKWAYVENSGEGTVSVIDTATNTAVAKIGTPGGAIGGGMVAVNPQGTRVYATIADSNRLWVIDTATKSLLTTISTGVYPQGVAVGPTGARVYVSNHRNSPPTVSVIDATTDTVITTVPVGPNPQGVGVTPDGARVYVANSGADANFTGHTVSVIDTTTNTVVDTVTVGMAPYSNGLFIGPRSACGNGVVDPGEQCDDGNLIDGDCCSSSCQFEAAGNPCSDNNACTQTDQCNGAGHCVGANPVICSALDQCHVAGTCDSGTGVCSNPTAADGAGCNAGNACLPAADACLSGVCVAEQCVSGTVGAGGMVTTDPAQNGATPAEPVQTTVALPGNTGGSVSITQTVATGSSPSGFSVLGEQVVITVNPDTPVTSDMPLELVFVIDASLLPPSADKNTIQLFKDGTLVEPCTGGAGVASPDPCVFDRQLLPNGDVQITVLTSTASVWTFAVPVPSQCGNGVLGAGEECDDGNLASGDSCPADCSYSASGSLIRGDNHKPTHDRAGCQVEWYVVNPNNPKDRFGLPNMNQTCEDQDPTCDFDPTPGRCGFEVVACLNNNDPNLPACTANGISNVEVMRPRARLLGLPAVAQIVAATQAKIEAALHALLDPMNPGAGYSNGPPLTASQASFCSAPMGLNIEVFSGSARPNERATTALTLRTRSRDNNSSRHRTQLSQLHLTCKARRLP